MEVKDIREVRTDRQLAIEVRARDDQFKGGTYEEVDNIILAAVSYQDDALLSGVLPGRCFTQRCPTRTMLYSAVFYQDDALLSGVLPLNWSSLAE